MEKGEIWIRRKYLKENRDKRHMWRARSKQWRHEKCWIEGEAEMHVYKRGTETGEKCYCGRKKLVDHPALRSMYFIES